MTHALKLTLLAIALCVPDVKASTQRPALLARGAGEPGKIERAIGNWYVSIEADPFTDKKKTLALTRSDRGILAIRCFPDEGLTAIIFTDTNKEYSKYNSLDFKYRADKGVVVQDSGRPFSGNGAILPNARQVLQDAMKSSNLYFRIDTPDGTMTDYVFHPQGAAKALSQINSDCPEPQSPPPEKDDSQVGDRPKL